MTGIVKTFLSEKKYGFIKGDDDKDYFFHQSSFKNKSSIKKICENLIVTFEQKATPKGYTAVSIIIEKIDEDSIKYIVPDNIYTSKESKIKGWDTMVVSNLVIHESSRSSPDFAKDKVKSLAKSYGANAIFDMQYYKTTGSEWGGGMNLLSTHYYTIHNFKGRLVNIAKRSTKGTHTKDELTNLNFITPAKDIKSNKWIYLPIAIIIVGVILIKSVNLFSTF